MAVAIHAENLSKAYQLGTIGTGTLSNDLVRWFAKVRGKEDPFSKIGEVNESLAKNGNQLVWSLKDLNFEIQQGEAVGIIGRNGAGKSTLLKLLSRVTAPTTGFIKGNGRIASLLEVGTGFHPELTGRENIFLNGTILGMRKREISRKFDEIVNFSGIEKYIDTPVKRYSSGMYVRLAFAVAAYLESEILIVDEILAVGDIEFQKKCIGKMDAVSKETGRTILFVSHQMSSIRSLCTKCIFLNNGLLEDIGKTEKIIQQYLNEGNNNKNIKFYTKYLKYVKIEQLASKIIIEAEYDVDAYLDIPHLGFIIYNSDSQPIFASNPSLEQIDPRGIKTTRKGRIIISVESPQLIDGKYHASIWFGNSRENFIEDLDSLVFEVIGMTKNQQYIQAFTGNVVPQTKWNFINHE